jgi:uncharacterized protein (TIGR00369 family)
VKLSELLGRQPDAATLQQGLDRVPYARHLGIRAELRGSELVFVLPRSEALVGNPTLPAVHGGVVGAFMELAGAFHLLARMEQPVLPKVIDFSLDYLRPTRLRETYAECEVTRQGRYVANVAIKAWQERRDTPCAIARAHFMVGED